MMNLNPQTIALAVQIVLILSAINWGLVSYNGTDLVRMVSMGFDKQVKLIVGIVGIYAAYKLYTALTNKPDAQ